MANDFAITHEMADLPPELWAYLKEHRFFAMIIKKEYGGLEFSAYAQARVLQKLSGVSGIGDHRRRPELAGSGRTAAALRYRRTEESLSAASGTRLWKSCFALTSPEAGSDAGAIPDTGVVCMGDWQGQQVLGMRLTGTNVISRWRLSPPCWGWLSNSLTRIVCWAEEELGITCALIPTSTPGVETSR